MRTAALLLLVASAALAHVEKGSRRVKREELLIRAKRRWVLSTIELTEEDKGPFPKAISQMHNDQLEKGSGHLFKISGAGVTEEPLGVFSINENNGTVYTHKPVDREVKALFHIKFDILDRTSGDKLDKELSFDVEIKDINDNPPKFLKSKIVEEIKENVAEGYLPGQLQATDPDQPNSPNSTIKFSMVSQKPSDPKMEIVQIDDRTAHLQYSGCFDYDKAKQYIIIAKAEDHGTPPLSSTAAIILKVQDSNTHPPTFKKTQYYAEINETDLIKDLFRVAVEDKDTPNTPGWLAKYYFISGNDDNNYEIVTDPKTNEGIFSVVKVKDFIRTTVTQIEIGVENVEPLFHCKYKAEAAPKTSTAYINLTVIDLNDPPTFDKDKINVHQKEEDPVGKVILTPKVTDIDSDDSKIRFTLLKDPAGWMTVDPKTGVVTTVKKMDRESPYVDEKNVYTVLVGAIDDGKPPATGTATVFIHLKDINDHKPMLVNSTIIHCTHMDSIPVKVEDLDAHPYGGPYSFAFDESDKKLKEQWKLNPTFGEESKLVMRTVLALGNYSVPLVIEDQQNLRNTETLVVIVCDCGETNTCLKQPLSVDVGGAAIGLILGSLLLFLLLLLIFVCNCGKQFQKLPNFLNDEGNQTLIKYNKEGGSSECKADPSMLLMTQTTTTNDIIVTDGQKFFQPGMTTYTKEDIAMYNSSYKNTYEEEMGTMGMYPGGMSSNDMHSYETWNNRYGMYTGASQYSRYSHQATQHISGYLHWKLQMLYGDHGQAEDVEYKPQEYNYEGRGSKSHSLDQLSLDNLDDLQFLNNLGPKFKTLGGICQQAIEKKNIQF